MEKEIRSGQAVLAQNAYGEWVPKKAVSGVETPSNGLPFVLVCDPDDWQKPGGKRAAVGWPAKYVKIA